MCVEAGTIALLQGPARPARGTHLLLLTAFPRGTQPSASGRAGIPRRLILAGRHFLEADQVVLLEELLLPDGLEATGDDFAGGNRSWLSRRVGAAAGGLSS
jgi:hypothetical protein